MAAPRKEPDRVAEPPKDPVRYVDATVRLPYHYVAGDYRARYLRALKDKTLLGPPFSKTGKAFVTAIVPRDQHRMATEMLYPVVREALAQCEVERDAIDYQIAGSTDYMDGRPFGFVAALDVIGSWPARQDLHLEMDAAFGAYYAWVK